MKIRIVKRDNGICGICGKLIEVGYDVESLDYSQTWCTELRMCTKCFKEVRDVFDEVE